MGFDEQGSRNVRASPQRAAELGTEDGRGRLWTVDADPGRSRLTGGPA